MPTFKKMVGYLDDWMQVIFRRKFCIYNNTPCKKPLDLWIIGYIEFPKEEIHK